MNAEREPVGRGRLNQLVQMFESRTQPGVPSTTGSPSFVKKLSRKKILRHQSDSHCAQTFTEQQQRVKPVKSSVNKLIQTFDAQGDEPATLPKQSGNQTSNPNRKRNTHQAPSLSLVHPDNRPENCEITSETTTTTTTYCRSGSIESGSSTDRDLLDDDDESYDSDSSDDESCISEAACEDSGHGGKIGALWTQMSNPFGDGGALSRGQSNASDVTAFCTKKLSQYMNLLEPFLSTETPKVAKSMIECSSLKARESILTILSRMNEVSSKHTDPSEKSTDLSVKTYKALIEMTVLEGEMMKPTISVVHRSPIPVLADDEDSVSIFAIDKATMASL